MKRFALSLFLAVAGALLVVFSAGAQRQDPAPHENFDIRGIRDRSLIDTIKPNRLWSFNGNLSAPSRGDAEDVARSFLRNKDDVFGLGADGVDELRVSRRYQTEHNGVTHVTLQQQINGIDIFQAEFSIHLDRENAVIAASGDLVPQAMRSFNFARPQLGASEAMRRGAEEVDRAAPFGDNVKTRLVYFPLAPNEMRLAWEIILPMLDTPDVYLMVIDAERGSMLYRFNLTCYDENPLKPHGPVFTRESPRPNVPKTSDSPAVVEREDQPFRSAPFNGTTIFDTGDSHYDWWVGAPASNLNGNNVNAYLDRDTTPGLPDQPLLMAPDGNFSFPVDLTEAPLTENNQKAAQVNLFYWVNRFHDILYSFGFNEAAGNFQRNNFGLGGQGQDAINAEAQDAGGTNNANFLTPPDGTPGRVQMFLWSGTPNRDGDFDQGVIIHELTHGLTNRLVGNATGLRGIQSGGMGEGWGDWFGLALLAKEGDDPAGSYPVGQFVTDNYQRGIRRFPYSTSMSTFPLTYEDLASRVQAHAIGEIWCNTLWEMRALLVQRYGFREGTRQSLQLVVDGLKLTPNAPTFLDARNAIIVADRVNNGGANQCLIWQAFAKRGSGFSATTDDANDGAPVEAFDVAPYCSATASLHLDKKEYVSGELLRISLSDQNAAGTVAVQLATSATGDHETLVLTPETGVDGSFLGTIRLAGATPVAGDGTLQGSAEKGDQVVITYDDPNSSGGGPAQAMANATITREKVIFEDTVELGNQGWLPTGGWAITSTRSSSSSRSWSDSPGEFNYVNGSTASLTSPLFDFTGLGEVTVTIAHTYQIENRFDLGVVEYSTDDGVTWARAANFTGVQAEFTQSRISLRGLNGQQRARIRFRLVADAVGVADGWYIDDIRLTARSSNSGAVGPAIAPTVSSIVPAFGPPAGGTRVTINGTNFTEDETTSVTFDGVPATSVRVLGGSTMTVTSPAHTTGPVNVHVVNRNGVGVAAGAFTYYTTGTVGPAPALTTIFPGSGSTRGATPVTVIGSGFTPGTEVSFGAVKGNVTFINATTLRVLTPAAGAGAVNVTAANGASVSTLTNAFSYIATTPPSVQVLTPNGGETYFARSVVNIRWSSSDNRAIVRHRLALIREVGGGVVTDIATDLPGSDQSFSWTLPSVDQPLQARVRVIAVDDEGAETIALSGSLFSILPRWERSAVLPVPLQRLQAASDGKFIYALGGRTTDVNSSTVATLQRLDPAPAAGLPVWTNTDLAPMPTGLNGGEAGFLQGKIYVPGGFTAAGTISSQHLAYDVAANSWTMPAQPPSGAALYSLAVDEPRGVFYVTGGSGASLSTTAARAYDPMTNGWTDLTPMGTARSGHESAVIEGKLYVAGGQGAASGLSSGEVYDFGSKQWSPIAQLNAPRAFAINVVTKDSEGNPLWFVFGGLNPDTGSGLGTEVYDVRNNRWRVADNSFLPTFMRTNMAGARLGEYFYAIGGSVPTTSTTLNERMRIDPVRFSPLDVAPVVAVPPAQIAVVNTEVRFTVSANDLASGVPVTITTEGLPAGANFTTTTVTNNSVGGVFVWTPPAGSAGQSFHISFTASDGQLSDTKVVVVQVVNASQLAVVNGANFRAGPVAADSIVSGFGTNLAVRTESAQALPLPLSLAGTVVTVDGIPAPLFYVSSDQINFVVPASVDPGPATIIVSNPMGLYALGVVEVIQSAPSIFTVDATGNGDAAAQATADGINYQDQPFDVTVDGKPNILILYGTGLRHAAAANPGDDNGVAESCNVTIDSQQAQVLYAGAQGFFTGLDQINVFFPSSLAGTGPRRVEVVLSINGIEANRVTVMIK